MEVDLAIGRTMAAILENGQQTDGSVKIPDALVPYFGSNFNKKLNIKNECFNFNNSFRISHFFS